MRIHSSPKRSNRSQKVCTGERETLATRGVAATVCGRKRRGGLTLPDWLVVWEGPFGQGRFLSLRQCILHSEEWMQ